MRYELVYREASYWDPHELDWQYSNEEWVIATLNCQLEAVRTLHKYKEEDLEYDGYYYVRPVP